MSTTSNQKLGERRPLLDSQRGSYRSQDSVVNISAPEVADPTETLQGGAQKPVSISKWRGTAIGVSLGVLIFLQASNFSVMTTIQGAIAEELDAYEDVSWFTSSFLVAMACVTPITGRLSYVVTSRTCIFTATIVLSIGSLITAFAPSLKVFLLGRAVSGSGAAGIISISVILAVQLTSERSRGFFTGLLNSGFTVGVAIGAIAASFIESSIGWRAIFWLQVPISLVAGVGLVLGIPSGLLAHRGTSSEPKRSTGAQLLRIDYIGALLLILTIVSLLYGLSTSPITGLPIIISALLFPLFILQEVYGHPDPIIPVTVLRSRAALLTNFATLGFMMVRWTVLFYTPIYATTVRGWSPSKSGSLLLPTNIGFALGGLLSGGIHIRRAGSWWGASVVVCGIFPFTMLALAFLATDHSDTWLVVFVVLLNGLCAGGCLNYTLHHVLYMISPDVRFIETSLIGTFRGFAGTFGSAIGGGLFARVLRASLVDGFARLGEEDRPDLIRRLVGSPRAVQSLEGAERLVAVEGYTKALKTLFFSGVGLSFLMLLFQAGTGWEAPTETRIRTEQAAPVVREQHDEAETS